MRKKRQDGRIFHAEGRKIALQGFSKDLCP